MNVTKISQFPFESIRNIFDFSTWAVVGTKAYIFGGGHAATTYPGVIECDLPMGQFRQMYPTIPYELMKEYDVISVVAPDETNATYIDTIGKWTATTGHPAGTTYRARWLNKSKVWIHPDYPPAPGARHSYDKWLHSSATGRNHLITDIEGTVLSGSPVRDMLLKGMGGEFDPVSAQWVFTEGRVFSGCVCEDPISGNFWILGDWWYVYDPRTRTVVKSVSLKGSSADKYWSPSRPSSEFKPDESVIFHPPSGGAIHVSRHDVPSIRYVEVDRATNLPKVHVLPVTLTDGTPSPTKTNMPWRKGVWNPDIGKFVGAFVGGQLWTIGLDVAAKTAKLERIKPSGAAFAGSNSCFCHAYVGGAHYFMANETASGHVDKFYRLDIGPASPLPPSPPTLPPTIEASVTPATLLYGGGMVTLNAATTDATEVRVNGVATVLPADFPILDDVTFEIEAVGPGGSVSTSVAVDVESAAEAHARLTAALAAEEADDAVYEATIAEQQTAIQLRDAMLSDRNDTISAQTTQIAALQAEVNRLSPDTGQPVVTVEATVSGSTATITFAATDNRPGSLTYVGRLDSAAFAEAVSPVTFTTEPGTHRYDVTATDIAGNVGAGFVEFTIIADAPPSPSPSPETPVITGSVPLWDGEAKQRKSGPAWKHENKPANLPWRRDGGAWIDADGVAYGPKPSATLTFVGTTATGDVTSLVTQDVNTGWLLFGTGSIKIVGRRHTTLAPPKLVITYRDGSTRELVASCTTHISASSSGTYYETLMAVDTGGKRGVMQFPDVPDRGNVVSAVMTLTSSAASAVRVKFFRVWHTKIFDWDADHVRQQGISQAYPKDTGIMAHPAVLTAEDWSDPSTWAEVEKPWRKTWYHNARAWIRLQGQGPHGTNCLSAVQPGPLANAKWGKYNVWDLNKTAIDAGRTRQMSRLRTDAGEVTVFHNPYNGQRTTSARDATRADGHYLLDYKHSDSPEHANMRVHLRFGEDYIQCYNEGSKLPGMSGHSGWWSAIGDYDNSQASGNGGRRTTGRRYKGELSGWTARMKIELRPSDGNPLGNVRAISVYLYHCYQSDLWGDSPNLGNHEQGFVFIDKDRWFCYEQEIKENSVRGLTTAEQAVRIAEVQAKNAGSSRPENIKELPVFDANGFDQWRNGEANPDGVIRVWVDGVLLFERTNMRWRRNTDIKIDQLPWFNYVHGGSLNPEVDHHHKEGSSVVTVGGVYIGPMKAA